MKIYLFIFFFIFSCSQAHISINELSRNFMFERQIEEKGLYIVNSYKVENVYYLYNLDFLKNKIQVAYFIVWSDEFPDFGLKYKTSKDDIIKQLFIPIIYTNWFYIPSSGGLQRIIYGAKDVEGVYAEYEIINNQLGDLINLTYESAGHLAISVSDKNKLKSEYTKNKSTIIEVASWNHNFKKVKKNYSNLAIFYPKFFHNEKWIELGMNNKRAEIVKKLLFK